MSNILNSFTWSQMTPWSDDLEEEAHLKCSESSVRLWRPSNRSVWSMEVSEISTFSAGSGEPMVRLYDPFQASSKREFEATAIYVTLFLVSSRFSQKRLLARKRKDTVCLSLQHDDTSGRKSRETHPPFGGLKITHRQRVSRNNGVCAPLQQETIARTKRFAIRCYKTFVHISNNTPPNQPIPAHLFSHQIIATTNC